MHQSRFRLNRVRGSYFRLATLPAILLISVGCAKSVIDTDAGQVTLVGKLGSIGSDRVLYTDTCAPANYYRLVDGGTTQSMGTSNASVVGRIVPKEAGLSTVPENLGTLVVEKVDQVFSVAAVSTCKVAGATADTATR